MWLEYLLLEKRMVFKALGERRRKDRILTLPECQLKKIGKELTEEKRKRLQESLIAQLVRALH